MSLNFCISKLSPQIHCSCLCADGCEVENLLKSYETAPAVAIKGFQAERFTQTPAFIILQFPVPIHIHQICITPYLGQQCAKVIQMYILQDYNNIKNCSTIDDDLIKFKAGRAVLETPVPVSFNNKYYEEDATLSSPLTTHLDSLVVNMNGRLNNVIAIKIGILAMLKGTIPSVARLSVWGKPSLRCDKALARNIMSKWKECNNETTSQAKKFYEQSISTKPEAADNLVTKELLLKSPGDTAALTFKRNDGFSEEFLDPIVHSLMKNPILLPSGHTIDRRTLDKHVQAQAEWGRMPSDPFTGIVFNDKLKPISNIQLKLRLDRYLLKQGSNISSQSEPHSSTKTCNTFVSSRKRGCSSLNDTVCVKRSVKPVPCNTDASNTSKPASLNHPKNLERISAKNLLRSGVNAVDSSLENALDKARSRLANYRTVSASVPSVNVLACAKCAVYLSSAITQYALPCQHRLCRNCLFATKELENSDMNCSMCKTSFRHIDVKRTYF